MNIRHKQALEHLQYFLASRLTSSHIYVDLYKQYNDQKNILDTNKLQLDITGSKQPELQQLSSFFTRHPLLSQLYQTTTCYVGQKAGHIPNPPTHLQLISNLKAGHPEKFYDLSDIQSVIIGRSINNSDQAHGITVNLPMYGKLSRRHLLLSSQEDVSSSRGKWTASDLGSTNGTFINGKRIQDRQVLCHGDHITLGYPHAGDMTVELVFEDPDQDPKLSNQSLTTVNPDLVLALVTLEQLHDEQALNLIQTVGNTPVYGVVIAADSSQANPSEMGDYDRLTSSAFQRITHNYPHLESCLEVRLLPFERLDKTHDEMKPEHQQQIDDLVTPLIELAKGYGPEILANRMTSFASSQITLIESAISTEGERLDNEIEQTKRYLDGHALDYWMKRSKESFKQVHEDGDSFFRNEYARLQSEKENSSSDIISGSLVKKIESQIRSLEPVVVRVRDKVCIGLELSPSKDLHSAMLRFSQEQLLIWAEQQWQWFTHGPEGGGMSSLNQRSYSRIHLLPELSVPAYFSFSHPKVPDLKRCFSDSFTDVETSISYEESTGEKFNGIAKIAMLAGGTAVAASTLSPYAVVQAGHTLTSLAALVGGGLRRPQQQQLKLEKICDSLKGVAITHYCKVARFLIARVCQELGRAMSSEERLFRKACEDSRDHMAASFNQIHDVLHGYSEKKKMLEADAIYLSKIRMATIGPTVQES